jgi:hypothetical protein
MSYTYLQLPSELSNDRTKDGAVDDDHVAINDVVLRIPPQSITVYKESLNHELATLRSLYTQKIKSGYGNAVVSMQIMFVGNDDINQKLKPLIAGLRATPFCTCYSPYLQGLLRGIEAVSNSEESAYFFLRPLGLAVKNIQISTVPGAPDSLSVNLEFSWFNYFPYMNKWVYKIGPPPFGVGLVFHSELWKEFYQPFISEVDLNWPHDEDSTEPPARIFFREYQTSPAYDLNANKAAEDLLSILKKKPKETQQLLQTFLKDKDVQWSDQNIWDAFWRKIGKDAILKGDNVSDAVRERFKKSEIQDGAITRALADAGAGDFLEMTARQAYTLEKFKPNSIIENSVDKAIRRLTQRNKDIKAFESKRPTESASESASVYVPLPELSITHDYSGKGGVKHTADVYGRKRKLDLGPNKGIIVEGISVNISYNLATIPMMAYRYPTMQYTGGVDINASLVMNCNRDGAKLVNNTYDVIETMAHKYRMVPQGYQNVWIQNDLLNFLGLKEFLTQRIMTETVEGQPERSQIILELTHAPVLSDTGVKEVEGLNQEAIWTTEGVELSILHRLRWLTVRGAERRQLDPGSLEAYLLEPKMNVYDPKNRAIGELVTRYVDAYNTALKKVMGQIFVSLYMTAENDPHVKALKKKMHDSGSYYGSYDSDKKAAYEKAFKQAQEDAKERRVKNEGVQESFNLYNFGYLMSFDEKNKIFGLLPNITEMQLAVMLRENALRDVAADSPIPRIKFKDGLTAQVAKAAHHDKRVRKMGITKEETQEAISRAKSDLQRATERFSFLGTYRAAVKNLAKDIQQNYLAMDEFKEIRKIVEEADVVLQTSPMYRDFDAQINRMMGYLTTMSPTASTNLGHYNPDIYLYNEAVDSPLINIEKSGILDAKVLDRAKQISLKSYRESQTKARGEFAKYYNNLQIGGNAFPSKWLQENVTKDAKWRGTSAGKSLYQHSIYSTQTFDNSLSEGTLVHPRDDEVAEDEGGTPGPITKRLICDQTQKANVNQTERQAMSAVKRISHTTDYPALCENIEVGRDGSLANESFSPPSSPYSKEVWTRDLNHLRPEFRTLVERVVAKLRGQGHELTVTNTYRSAAAQAKAGSGGKSNRTKPGAHTWGYAVDMLPNSFNEGTRNPKNRKFYEAVGRAVEEVGQGQLSWGGNYKYKRYPKKHPKAGQRYESWWGQKSWNIGWDPGHFEMKNKPIKKDILMEQQDDATKVKQDIVAKNRTKSVKKDVTSTSVSPLQLSYEEFQNDLYTGQALGLTRAYPAFKLFFIEDDHGERRLGFDDFFNYSAVQSIRVVRDRHIAADLCEIYLTNLSGVLSNRRFKQERNPEKGRDAEGKVAVDNAKHADTKAENPLASMMLKEGVHFSLYLGYSNRLENMELVFTGVITELEFMGSEEVVRVLGQSYAIELVQDIKGVTKPRVTDNMTIKGLDFWGIGGNAYTSDLLEEMITQPEVLHFGRWTALRKKVTANRDLLTNKYQFEPKPQDDNIFAPSPKQNLKNFADGTIFQSLRYVIYQTTVWDIFQEMTLRHPNFIAAAVPYREIGNDRMTMFFGLPNQLYFARDPDFKENNVSEAMRREQAELEGKLFRLNLGGGRRQRQACENCHYPPVEQEKQALQESIDSLRNDRLTYGKKQQYIKPFRKYHLLTSSYHIVSNNIQANARDVANTVTVRYNADLPGKDDIIAGVKNSDFALAHADEEVTVKIDAALPDEETRTQVASFLNVSNSNLARRYALGLLLRNTKNTYKGELVILGNPKIKPHDVCYLFDEYNDMIGPIEVDRVIHVFTPDQGFITEIKPAMLTQVGEWALMHSCTAMGIVMEEAVKNIFGRKARGGVAQVAEAGYSLMAPVAGALFDYFGGFMSDAILNYTQFGFPLVMTPLMHRGRIFAGGVPTHKLPKSMWKCIFGDWTPQADEGFDLWLEDKVDEIMSTLKTVTGGHSQGSFWSNSNTLKVKDDG